MKKMSWKLNMIVLSLLLVIVLFPKQTVCSAQKKQSSSKGNISCSVNNGTLTLSGKGAMPSGMKFNNYKNIKKVIVEKGITSLPIYAFDSLKQVEEIKIADTVCKIGADALPNSKKLKKVTMPGTFQYMPEEEIDYRTGIISAQRAQINTIIFNTPLSLKTLSYVKGRNLIVSKGDKKYKSIKGVIYSKDGKSIVRVPAYRETLTVEEGCEEFCIQAVKYGRTYGDHQDAPEIICQELKKIVLPASIRSVNEKKYYAVVSENSRVKEIEVKSKKLKNKDILSLLSSFSLSKKQFLEQFDDITYKDGLCINTRDASILFYQGDADEFEISGQTRRIEAEAFRGSRLERITIPDSVTWIGQGAFRSCGRLQEVSLPKTMTRIPKKMFQSCIALKNITLPENVTVIGEDAFRQTSVPPSILLQGKIEEIGSGAFMDVDRYSRWDTFELPKTVKKVGVAAFSMTTLHKVTICGPTDQISPWAFINYSDEGKNPTLTFLEKIGHWQTEFGLSDWSDDAMKVDISWRKITGVDGWQIQVSPDKSFRKKKTYYAKKEKTSMKLTDRKMCMKYVRIRPYKTSGGKREYGRWVSDNINRYSS